MFRLARVDPGFDPHNLQTCMFSLTGPAWPDARKQTFYETVVERLRAVPGVENAAITYSLPILGSNWWNVFHARRHDCRSLDIGRRDSSCRHGAGDESLVFGVAPTDSATLGAVTVLLAVVAIAACYVPARAAARLDPLVALRQD